MTKLKPIKRFAEDVKEGDLVRLVGTQLYSKDKPIEITGYFQKFGVRKEYAYAIFGYRPEGNAFSVRIKDGYCIDFGRDNSFQEHMHEYEILRRLKND
ncbi:hypothetical protein KY332_01160 [Candidatus Woesearchaeota archaeon]|nr:hypothetical protein [Candidatus Woesearchaeota archaeon]